MTHTSSTRLLMSLKPTLSVLAGGRIGAKGARIMWIGGGYREIFSYP